MSLVVHAGVPGWLFLRARKIRCAVLVSSSGFELLAVVSVACIGRQRINLSTMFNPTTTDDR